MDKFKNKKSKCATTLAMTFLILLIGAGVFAGAFGDKLSQKISAAETEGSRSPQPLALPEELKPSIDKAFREAIEWPVLIDANKKKIKVEYSFNPDLVSHIKKTLQLYRSDYSTVTVIDNETGEILAAVGHEGKNNTFDNHLVLASTNPSASLIKIVTAAELIRSLKVTKETEFVFRGKSTTLFRYQLNDSKNNRWDKTQTFEEAFAKSNNVIFGKAAIKNIEGDKLIHMAENFGFNQSVLHELDFVKSHIVSVMRDDYHLAETASGFNVETMISPIHAALMASIIANDGIMRNPKLIRNIVDINSGENLWKNSTFEKRVLPLETSQRMQELMKMTIDDGTAKKSFRKMNNGYKNVLDMGGKTGSITGGKPFGKRDWFAAYAIPHDRERGKGISISVMNVNVKKWHVRSTMLAKDIIEYYYNNIKPVPVVMVKMPRLLGKGMRARRVNERRIASKQIAKKKFKNNRRVNDKRQMGKINERKSNSRI